METSLLKKNELTGKSENKFAAVSGNVRSKMSGEAIYALIVVFRDLASGNVFSSNTDFDGNFSFNLPPANYTLSISSPEAPTLLEQITVETGEIRKLEIEMGETKMFVEYEIKSRKKLSKKELKKVEKDLRRR